MSRFMVQEYVLCLYNYFIQVTFIGEDGYDNGGLLREFFSLLSKEMLA